MKRTLGLFFIVLFLVVLAPLNQAHATTDVAFTTSRLSDFASVAIRVGASIGFDIGGLIIPFFQKEKQIAQPDHESPGNWKQNALQYMTPQEYNDDGKHIHWDAEKNPVFYTSLYGAILKTDAEHSNHPEPTDCYISHGLQKSADVPKAPLDFETAQASDGWYGIVPVNPNETGVVDFNREPTWLAGMNPNEDCKKNELGAEQAPYENDLKSLSSFADGSNIVGQEIVDIFTTITKWVKDHWETTKDYEKEPNKKEVILTEKKKEPHYNCKTHDGGGPENEAGDCSGDSPKTGGWTAFTLTPDDQKATDSSSEQAYDITVAGFPQKPLKATYDLMNIAQIRMEQAACYSTPDTAGASYDNIQSNFAIGKIRFNDQCSPAAVETPSGNWNCNTNLPEQASTSLNTAGQSYADSGIFDCADSKENAWKQCHNDVMYRAKKSCIDPIFALAIWLHESGASNYKCSEQTTGGVKVQDFGINIPSIAENFSAQLDAFLKLDYACPHTIKDFFSVYAVGKTKTGGGYQCYNDLSTVPDPATGKSDRQKVDDYTGEIQYLYGDILGGGTLPSWPKGSCSQ